MCTTFHFAKFGNKRKSSTPSGFTLTDEQFERMMNTRFKRTKEDDDDDFDITAADRVATRLRTASAKAFEAGSLVHLGALRNPQDVGYSYGHDSFSVAINSKAALSAQIKIKNPESWADFSLLFNRLIVGYVTFFPEFHQKFLCYLERLQQYVDFRIASPTAMIEYDRRVRTANHDSWSWLDFDTQVFEVCKFLSPVTLSHQPQASPSLQSKVSSLPRRSANICRDWITGTCASKRKSCRFAHHCTNVKCVQAGSTNHKPGEPGCLK